MGADAPSGCSRRSLQDWPCRCCSRPSPTSCSRALRRLLLEGSSPEPFSDELRVESLRQLTGNAAEGGSLALAMGLIAALVAARRLRPRAGALGVVALITADLVRAGAAVNPMVTPSFYEPFQGSRQLAAQVAAGGGRVFSCNPNSSLRLFQLLRSGGGEDDVRSIAAMKATLSPSHNMRLRLLSAYSRDYTGLVSGRPRLFPRGPRVQGFPGAPRSPPPSRGLARPHAGSALRPGPHSRRDGPPRDTRSAPRIPLPDPDAAPAPCDRASRSARRFGAGRRSTRLHPGIPGRRRSGGRGNH